MSHAPPPTRAGLPTVRIPRPVSVLSAAVMLVLAALLPAEGAAARSADAEASFSNPLVTRNAADPWIVHYRGDYYHLGTTWASHWEMRRSPTLAGLRDAPPVTVYTESEPARCCNFWAPELHRLSGPNGPRWYLTYTAGIAENIDHQHVHVLESAGDDPLGPYTYKGQVDPYGDNRWMIDSSYLTTDDGRLYLLYSYWENGTQNLYIAPMANPWTPAGAGRRIATPVYDWERQGAPVNEGAVVLEHGGRTFLTYSASFCDTPNYKLGLMELLGADPMDAASWRKYPEPVFERNDAAGVYGPGHNGFFTSPDGRETWIVYHANDSASDGCSGTRTTRAQKVEWNPDGTPDFGTPVAPGVQLAEPSG